MSYDLERIKKLLGNNLTPAIVASTIGCTESYISQLLSDETFATDVATIRTKDLLKLKSIDEKYDNLEELLLKKLEDLLPFFTKPRDILSALQVVNGAKRKASGISSDIMAGTVVRLDLPMVIINHYKINMQGGMIEVGGRDLTPLPSSILLKQIEDKNKALKNQPKTLEHNANGSDNVPYEQTSQTPQKFIERNPQTNIPSERILSADSV